MFKILTHLKIETKYIQLNGGKYKKLQNQSCFKKYDTFPDNFIKCQDNVIEAIDIPNEVTNDIKQMSV